MKDWVRLEVDYARELMFIKNKLEKIPSKFQHSALYEYFAAVVKITSEQHYAFA